MMKLTTFICVMTWGHLAHARCQGCEGEKTRRDVQTEETNSATLEVQFTYPDGRQGTVSVTEIENFLITAKTPVFNATVDSSAHQGIRYDPSNSAFYNISFRLYQNTQRDAAIVRFDSVPGSADSYLSGVVDGYALQRIEIGTRTERSVENVGKIPHYTLIKSPDLNRRLERDASAVNEKYVSLKNARSRRSIPRLGPVPSPVFPKILALYDYPLDQEKSGEDLRFFLTYWNAVDMMFAKLSSPVEKLHIAAVIRNKISSGFPYFKKTTDSSAIDVNETRKAIHEHFENETNRFPLDNYDIIIAMTTLSMYRGESRVSASYQLNTSPASTSTQKPTKIGVVSYGKDLATYLQASGEISYTMAVENNDAEVAAFDPSAKLDGKYVWTVQALRAIENYFSTFESSTMDRYPFDRRYHNSTLPGKWLSDKGQCSNAGFLLNCPLLPNECNKQLRCVNDPFANQCESATNRPLEGTTCDYNMSCRNNLCVAD